MLHSGFSSAELGHSTAEYLGGFYTKCVGNGTSTQGRGPDGDGEGRPEGLFMVTGKPEHIALTKFFSPFSPPWLNAQFTGGGPHA